MAQQGKHFYEFGAFRLDPDERVLLRDREPVPLPPKVCETLLGLVERSGHIVDKDELMRKVWPDTFVEEANLSQNIFTLRKVLGDTPEGHHYIETVPRRGYRFVAPVEERTEESAPEAIRQPAATPSQRRVRRSVLIFAATGGVLALLVVTYLLRGRLAHHAAAPSEGKIMLAVLPFENLSGDPEQEFFSDGFTEEMITQLGRLHPERLGVIARSSVMGFKHGDRQVDQIGRKLGVQYVLEGSARSAAGRVRITAQLIQVKDQSHVWADTYDRDVRDVLALQSEVARAIAAEIQLKLTPQQQARLAQLRQVSPEAYGAYLKGRYNWNRRTPESLKKSVEYFEQAISDDPNYALAYAGLADSYNILGNFSLLAPKEAYPKAKAAARKALELDDSLGEAHTALAFATYLSDWDWPAAETEFKRAIELNPNYGPAHQWYAVSLVSRGRTDEAIAEAKRAAEAEPLSMIINAVVGWVYYLSHEYDHTIQQCQRTLEMDPSFSHAHIYIGQAYEQKGMHEEAVAEFLNGDPSRGLPYMLGALGYAYARAGKKNQALDLLRTMKERSKKGYFPASQIAVIYAGLDEKDQAFAWLEKAYQDRFPWLIHLNAEPMFDSLHADPRFGDLVRRIGLPP